MKIKYKDLRGKSEQELMEMKKQMEFHFQKANIPKNIGEKGFSIKQEKRNIARINTLLRKLKGGKGNDRNTRKTKSNSRAT